ncbi:MAG: aquaporin Z [Solirubrobacteraceae bacterium]
MAQRRAAAEFVGTFVLVFGGVGSAVIAGDVISALGVALAFGLALLCMAYAIGPISGCHINPAVTFGLLLSGKIERDEAVRYVIAQTLGAIAAALLLLIIVKSAPGEYDLAENGFGANGFGDHSPGGYPIVAAIIAEVVLTALLVFTVLAATDRIANVAFAGIPIGFVLVLIHLVGIPIDNTSVNPARSIGPAVFVLDWAIAQLIVFILAPLAGAFAGATLHKYLFADSTPVPAEQSAVASETSETTETTETSETT